MTELRGRRGVERAVGWTVDHRHLLGTVIGFLFGMWILTGHAGWLGATVGVVYIRVLLAEAWASAPEISDERRSAR